MRLLVLLSLLASFLVCSSGFSNICAEILAGRKRRFSHLTTLTKNEQTFIATVLDHLIRDGSHDLSGDEADAFTTFIVRRRPNERIYRGNPVNHGAPGRLIFNAPENDDTRLVLKLPASGEESVWSALSGPGRVHLVRSLEMLLRTALYLAREDGVHHDRIPLDSGFSPTRLFYAATHGVIIGECRLVNTAMAGLLLMLGAPRTSVRLITALSRPTSHLFGEVEIDSTWVEFDATPHVTAAEARRPDRLDLLREREDRLEMLRAARLSNRVRYADSILVIHPAAYVPIEREHDHGIVVLHFPDGTHMAVGKASQISHHLGSLRRTYPNLRRLGVVSGLAQMLSDRRFDPLLAEIQEIQLFSIPSDDDVRSLANTDKLPSLRNLKIEMFTTAQFTIFARSEKAAQLESLSVVALNDSSVSELRRFRALRHLDLGTAANGLRAFERLAQLRLSHLTSMSIELPTRDSAVAVRHILNAPFIDDLTKLKISAHHYSHWGKPTVEALVDGLLHRRDPLELDLRMVYHRHTPWAASQVAALPRHVEVYFGPPDWPTR